MLSLGYKNYETFLYFRKDDVLTQDIMKDMKVV